MRLRVPMKYLSKVLWGEIPKQTFLITDEGEQIKFGVLIYADSEDEVYLRMTSQLRGMVNDYELHDDDNGGSRGVFKKSRRCLDGDALETFDEIKEAEADNNEKPTKRGTRSRQEVDGKFRNPCRFHPDEHDWYDCPRNPQSKFYNEGNDEKEKEKAEEIISKKEKKKKKKDKDKKKSKESKSDKVAYFTELHYDSDYIESDDEGHRKGLW